MAFMVKQERAVHKSSDGTAPVVSQWIKVSRAAAALPQTATATIFEVRGGRILLKALVGEVTTAIQNQANNFSYVIDSDAGAADDLSSAADIANLGVGTYIVPEGDGTATIFGGIGWGQTILAGNGVIVGAGLIRVTTSTSNTGAVKYDLYYQPLDATAYVVAV